MGAMTKKKRRIIAYHEAVHAVAARAEKGITKMGKGTKRHQLNAGDVAMLLKEGCGDLVFGLIELFEFEGPVTLTAVGVNGMMVKIDGDFKDGEFDMAITAPVLPGWAKE